MNTNWLLHLKDGTTIPQIGPNGPTRLKDLRPIKEKILRLEVCGLGTSLFLEWPDSACPRFFERKRIEQYADGDVQKHWSYYGYVGCTQSCFIVVHHHANRVSVEYTDQKTPDWEQVVDRLGAGS